MLTMFNNKAYKLDKGNKINYQKYGSFLGSESKEDFSVTRTSDSTLDSLLIQKISAKRMGSCYQQNTDNDLLKRAKKATVQLLRNRGVD